MRRARAAIAEVPLPLAVAYREWSAFERLSDAGTPTSARESGHLRFERVSETTTRVDLRFDSDTGIEEGDRDGIPSPSAVTLKRFVAFLDEHSWPVPPALLRAQRQATGARA